jgi:hypothetical protein
LSDIGRQTVVLAYRKAAAVNRHGRVVFAAIADFDHGFGRVAATIPLYQFGQ